MTRWIYVVVALGMVGCASKADGGGDGTEEGEEQETKEAKLVCAGREGSYRVEYVERSGNCGDRSEQIFDGAQQSGTTFEAPAPCEGQGRVEENNCKVISDVTCPSKVGGVTYKVKEQGVYNWAYDAKSATGTSQVIIYAPDGSAECTSTYDVKVKKL